MTRYLVGALAAAALAFAGCNNRAGTGYSGNQNATPSNGAYDQGQGGQNTATAHGTYGSADEGASKANQPGQLLNVTGTVKDTSGDSITLVTPNQGQVKLNTNDQTHFIGPSGQKIDKDALSQGAEVRAAYKFDGKENQASRIQVTQVPASQQKDFQQKQQDEQKKQMDQNSDYNK